MSFNLFAKVYETIKLMRVNIDLWQHWSFQKYWDGVKQLCIFLLMVLMIHGCWVLFTLALSHSLAWVSTVSARHQIHSCRYQASFCKIWFNHQRRMMSLSRGFMSKKLENIDRYLHPIIFFNFVLIVQVIVPPCIFWGWIRALPRGPRISWWFSWGFFSIDGRGPHFCYLTCRNLPRSLI